MHSLDIIKARNNPDGIGRKFVFKDTFKTRQMVEAGDITIGKEYEIAGIDYAGDRYFIDDVQDENFAIALQLGYTKEGIDYEFKDS
jgi:hypothetical protein